MYVMVAFNKKNNNVCWDYIKLSELEYYLLDSNSVFTAMQ